MYAAACVSSDNVLVKPGDWGWKHAGLVLLHFAKPAVHCTSVDCDCTSFHDA